MKRRVVLHGPSTLTVSLPAEWAKKFNIGKGDELNVEEVGSELRISTAKSFSLDKKEVNVKNYQRLGKSTLTSLYRQGYGEIELLYDDASYIQTIQKLIGDDVTGFEIVKQSSNSCTIKDLTGHSKDEFETILKSTWILLLDLSRESLEAMKEANKTGLENISVMDKSINKFSNYCLRLLATSSNIDHRKSYIYYFFVKSLENIADKYKDLCSSYSASKGKLQGSQAELFLKTNRHLEELFELFYRYNEANVENFFKKTKKTIDSLLKESSFVSQFLLSINADIRNLISTLIELNIS